MKQLTPRWSFSSTAPGAPTWSSFHLSAGAGPGAEVPLQTPQWTAHGLHKQTDVTHQLNNQWKHLFSILLFTGVFSIYNHTESLSLSVSLAFSLSHTHAQQQRVIFTTLLQIPGGLQSLQTHLYELMDVGKCSHTAQSPGSSYALRREEHQVSYSKIKHACQVGFRNS